jgi:hypothetical protein
MGLTYERQTWARPISVGASCAGLIYVRPTYVRPTYAGHVLRGHVSMGYVLRGHFLMELSDSPRQLVLDHFQWQLGIYSSYVSGWRRSQL